MVQQFLIKYGLKLTFRNSRPHILSLRASSSIAFNHHYLNGTQTTRGLWQSAYQLSPFALSHFEERSLLFVLCGRPHEVATRRCIPCLQQGLQKFSMVSKLCTVQWHEGLYICRLHRDGISQINRMAEYCRRSSLKIVYFAKCAFRGMKSCHSHTFYEEWVVVSDGFQPPKIQNSYKGQNFVQTSYKPHLKPMQTAYKAHISYKTDTKFS